MFDPDSVALIGASEEEGSVGRTILENLLKSYQGDVYAVNPNHNRVLDMDCLSSVGEIGKAVDLAIIATPASTVPDIVRECGEAEIPSLVIISAGFKETGSEGKKLEKRIDDIRKEYGMRVLGPNCLGLIVPRIGLNASFADQMPEEGTIVLISQSGALATSILDWSIEAHVGFSGFVSLGNMLDVSFGDLIDYFGQDPGTRSILMYIESVKDARNFMSAARSFARTKPIVAVKSGKFERSAKALQSHTGSLAGEDNVYNAALQRVGVTRVNEIEDLFNVSKILETQSPPEGPNMAIITNAGGPGIMASDALLEKRGSLASLSEGTVGKLKGFLPKHAGLLNPVDIIGDAGVDRYERAIRTCIGDEDVDGALVIYTPQGEASPEDLARKIIEITRDESKPIFTSFIGGKKVEPSRGELVKAGVPAYSSPEQAVQSYMYMYRYSRNLRELYQTPEELPVDSAPPKHHLKAMLTRIARSGREVLMEDESKKLLDTYGIPTVQAKVAEDPSGASQLARETGFPVVLKVRSPDITHKSDVGGVVTGLKNEEEVEEAYEDMLSRMKEREPDADIQGVTVQKMLQDVDYELILGSKRDVMFGPVIMFGRGGIDVEIYQDIAVGFPPLNQVLARMLMEETKVYDLISGFRGKKPADLRTLEEYLVRFSQLLIDFPEISELDVNPFAVSEGGFMALDARVIIDADTTLSDVEPHSHLVIEPYPRRYVQEWSMKDGTSVTLRPIRPEDEPLEFELFKTFSPETYRFRFFGPPKEMTHEDMVRFTNIDYRREMAIVAEMGEDDERKMLGVGRLIVGPDFQSARFAVVVGDPWHGKGLGTKLVDMLIGVSRDKGLSKVQGLIQRDNEVMIHICENMGFEIVSYDQETVKATIEL